MLQSLADPISQTLQRYFLSISRLKHQGSGNLTAQQLEEQSTLLAQRLSLLYGINAPEFFDKALFRALIRQLIDSGMISCGEDDVLSFDEDLNPLMSILENLLDANLRQTILISL